MAHKIGRRPDRDDEVGEAIELLRGRSTGTLGHALSLGYAHGLSPLMRPASAVGEVVTAQVTAFDGSAVHYAVSQLQPGDVLVIDTGGEVKRAPWGGSTSYAAYQASAAGVIVDGPVTDWDEITTMGVQTWARGTTSLTYRLVASGDPEGGVNVPIVVSGTIVRPGDVAFADSDGIFFIERARALAIGRRLLDLTDAQPESWRAMARGARMYDLKGRKEKYEEQAVQE